MVNADIIRIIADSEGKVIVEDMNSTGYGVEPVKDEYTDIEYSLGIKNEDTITGKFKRLVKPLDLLDATIILNETMDIFYILGDDYTIDPSLATVEFYKDSFNSYECHYRCIYCVGPLAN